MGRNALERFFDKVEKTESCWFWKGSTNLDGYGRFNPNGRLVGAHRFIYETLIGPINDLHALHRCDIPNYVNPEHLFLGTHSDNMQDMYKKKRHGNGKPCINHPDRAQYCKELCRKCYFDQWRSNNLEKMRAYSKKSYYKNRVLKSK